jgi:hypothetical protein
MGRPQVGMGRLAPLVAARFRRLMTARDLTMLL